MAPLKWSPEVLPSLSGRTYLVTGGNTGIGYWTVYHLALRGASVYLTSRSEEKGIDAIAKLRRLSQGLIRQISLNSTSLSWT